MTRLNDSTINRLQGLLDLPSPIKGTGKNHIVHFGVGGFHRSHQAYAWHRLRQEHPAQYADWSILGVSLMPTDGTLVKHLREQDYLYALRMRSAAGTDEIQVINSIRTVLYGPEDTTAIVEAIANGDTKLISFTITEGGYNVDDEARRFIWENEAVRDDLAPSSAPKTIFGFLARGLQKRRLSNQGVVLLSCDNIQHNGDILRFALLSFLEKYDQELREWVAAHVRFPNSMVDRITPVTTEDDKRDFEARFGLRDEALVVSEAYFQWVLENSGLDGIPPLSDVGVQLVSDVRPYEAMKLGLLNAGHSLVGLLGDALGYTKIHDAIGDRQISPLFDRYALCEAIPVLTPIEGVDFHRYVETVKSRFSNAMINDSTARIISGSSDKIPKFILPTIEKQRSRDKPQMDVAALIIAAWWYYLYRAYNQDGMAQLADSKRDEFRLIFQDSHGSADRFLAYRPVFADLGKVTRFREKYMECVAGFREGRIRKTIKQVITGGIDE